MTAWGIVLALSMRSSWRAGRGAGPSPGVLYFEYRFDEGLTPRANGWPASSGRRAVAVLSPNPISLRRVRSLRRTVPSTAEYPPRPYDDVLRRRRRGDFTPAPVPSAPAAARSQALRALQATRPGVIIGDGETLAGKSGRESDKRLESLRQDQRHCDSWRRSGPLRLAGFAGDPPPPGGRILVFAFLPPWGRWRGAE